MQDAASDGEGFRHLEMPEGFSGNRLNQVAAFKAIGFPASAAAHFMAHQIARWPQPGAYHRGPCLAGLLQAPEMLFSSATLFLKSLNHLLGLEQRCPLVAPVELHHLSGFAHVPAPGLQVSAAMRLFYRMFQNLPVD